MCLVLSLPDSDESNPNLDPNLNPNQVCLVLSLSDSDESRAVWPHAFELRYTVTPRHCGTTH